MDKKLFQYAPGLVGFGTEGNDGATGLQGISFYFSTFDGIENISILTGKITDNKQLDDSDTDLPDNRVYLTGDTFLDINGKIFEIDLSVGNLYTDTDMFLNSSSIFEVGSVQPDTPGFTRYTNLFNSDKILIDSVYANNVGNYTEIPTQIYDNDSINYGTINYVDEDIIGDLNNVYLFNLWSTGLSGDENAIGLVRERDDNIWHLGNLNKFSPRVQRSVALDLDFSSVDINNNLNINNTLSVSGTTYVNNINVQDSGYGYGDWVFYNNITFSDATPGTGYGAEVNSNISKLDLSSLSKY